MHGTSQGGAVPLTTYGGLVTLADPSSVPEGASPRVHDMDFLVGSTKTRDGLTSVYSNVTNTVGPSPPQTATSTTWTNPTAIEVGDGSYTSFGPVSNPNTILIQNFGFSISPADNIAGILLTLTGYANAPCTLFAQMLIDGIPTGASKSIVLPNSPTVFTLGGLSDNWGNFLLPATVNNHNFGMQLSVENTLGFSGATAFLDLAEISVGLNVNGSNFDFITTFTQQDGTIKNLLLDASGNFYVEDVTNNPGVLTLTMEDITPNSYSVSVNGPDVEYMAISDLTTGSDLPLQYTPNWIDRITQVGPGAAPAFTPAAATSNTFAIATITQNPPNSDITDPGNLSVLLQSAGPGSTAPGNVLTIYYSPSFFGGAPHPEAQDLVLVNAFNAGYAVYVYISGAGAPWDGNYLVTGVGNAQPPGVDHDRYFFTVQVPTSAYTRVVEAPGQYQLSVATLTTSVPVPGLEVGNNITISGMTVAAWDGTWPISRALNSAEMVINDTSVTASVATYNYSVVTGTPPAVGQLVTVTGTTNANGLLNVTNATIATASGGTSGTFTVNVPVTTATSSPESGQASTAGTIFCFDPGLPQLGTTTSPIFGNDSSGTGVLTFVSAAAQLIGPGTRQGSVFFITRNGYYTCPAPPVMFTCPENTTALIASLIPIGPPNVIARGIIITEAGQNGVPGANFFTIPNPVSYVVSNVTYTASSFIINDNTTTSATLTFTDSVLLNALAVDVYGYNLFNQIEIGDCGWVVNYASRNFYGLCRNKIQNFLNLSFDGGYIPQASSGQLTPLGWSQPDLTGQLVVSPKFGNAYYVSNPGPEPLAVAGLISQGAFQDAYKIPIIQPNTTYSVRISARQPAGIPSGNLVISLTAGGITYGSASFGGFGTDYSIKTATLLTTKFLAVPPGLLLNLSVTSLAVGADFEIDRFDVYPTEIPILTTTIYGSYAGLPEQVDSVTGQVGVSSENQQPVNGAVVMYDTLYLLKGTLQGSSMYSLQSSANLEPAQWEEPEVAQKSGSIGILSYDFGEQWVVMANRNGLYLFEGGQPGKISQEIFQVWDAINWQAGNTIWVKNDVVHRRLFIGVPMTTPNFWLPDAPSAIAPASPNVILMLNYQGIDTGQELKAMPQMHTTMFGTLNAIDMRRKWSIWQIPSPYANFVESKAPTLTNSRFFGPIYEPGPLENNLYICNGVQNSKVYYLDSTRQNDDGAIIDFRYTTAGIPEMSKRAQMPALGNGNTRTGFMWAQIQSLGNVNVRYLPNVIIYPEVPEYRTWTVPGGFSPGSPALYDCKAPVNFFGTRTFVEFRENDGFGFSLSNFQLHMKKDPWNSVTGGKVTP